MSTVCPGCKARDTAILTDAGYGRTGQKGVFESGACYFVRLECPGCGRAWTVTAPGAVMTKAQEEQQQP